MVSDKMGGWFCEVIVRRMIDDTVCERTFFFDPKSPVRDTDMPDIGSVLRIRLSIRRVPFTTEVSVLAPFGRSDDQW